MSALVIEPHGRRIAAGLAIGLGAAAWVKLVVSAYRAGGAVSTIFSALWTLVGAFAMSGAGIALTWLARTGRLERHPWYAHPEWLFISILAGQLAILWTLVRLVGKLPARFGVRYPDAPWIVILPVWLGLAAWAERQMPGAAYLWSGPLLCAGLLFLVTPLSRMEALRTASAILLAIAGTVWLPVTRELAFFLIAMLGRLPIVTPVFVYAAVLSIAGLVLFPPALGLVRGATAHRALAPRTGIALFIAVIASVIVMRLLPAYTSERPGRRSIAYVEDHSTQAGGAAWWIAGNEPLVGLPGTASQLAWRPYERTAGAQDIAPPIRNAFVHRADASPVGRTPGTLASTVTREPGHTVLVVRARPAATGTRIALRLARGVLPLASNLPGLVLSDGCWTATYIAPRQEGITFRMWFAEGADARLDEARIVFMTNAVPGGAPPLGLPAWLPQETTVWNAWSFDLIPLPR
jgi:hypothetical protein